MRGHRLFLALAALAVGGCQCPQQTVEDAGAAVDAGPQQLTEKEPNDSADKALAIDGNAVVEANLGADPKKLDADWYELKAGLPRTATLEVTCPPGADVALELVDETGTVLSRINEGGVDQPERYPNLDVSGHAFARVVGVKKGAGGAYRFTVTTAARQPGFELEPNDRQVDATPVPLGQAVSGFIAHGEDVDWYSFQLPNEGGEEGPAEDAGATPAPAPETPTAPTPPPSPEPGTPPMDQPAPADAPEGGGKSPLAVLGTAAAEPPDAGPPAVPKLPLRVDISPVEGVAFQVDVMTEAEAVLFSAKSQPGAGLSLRNVGVRASDRTIFVVVKSLKTSNFDTYYTLSVSPEEAGDGAELEPNNDAAHATDVPANSYRVGFLAPRGDVDVFRLLSPEPSLVKVEVEGVEKVDFELSAIRPVEGKADEVLVKANEGGVKEPERLNNVACQGECFFKVESALRKVGGKWARPDENGDQPYRITLNVTADDGSEEKEPNGTVQTANPLELGRPVRGTVFPVKDVDHFSLNLKDRPVKTPLSARLIGVLKVDVALYLHRVEDDGKLTLVQTSDGAKGDRPEELRYAAEPGLYVFEVRDVKNRQSNFQDSYQLTVEEGAE